MIHVICKSEAYTYNVYHIIKAFFPSEKITAETEEEASHYVAVSLPDAEDIRIGETEILRAAGPHAQDREDPKDPEVKMIRYGIDLVLYERLEELTGRPQAWGILTGVRPTKIAMEKLEERWTKDRFVPWFQQECKVSPGKAELSFEIAEREQELLGKLDREDGYSLYVGIPFCPSVCTYCSFSSGALKDWKDRIWDYLSALQKELAFIGAECQCRKLNTIYIGGGTPTTLTAVQLQSLLDCIDTYFSREYLKEYTVEAGRPDSITREKLQVLRDHGITRISINPQSMQQKTLDAIGRHHRVEEITEAYRLAREMGFDNINMDLIAGLPGETVRDMEDTLKKIKELSPDSLTVHSLAVKRAAKMELKDLEPDAQKTAAVLSEMIKAAQETAQEMGLFPYYLYRQKNIAGNFENVGYAKDGRAGIYNVLIMEEKQSVIAAGAGASPKIVLKEPVPVPGNQKKKMTKLLRIENVKDVGQYIERIDEMLLRKRGLWGEES